MEWLNLMGSPSVRLWLAQAMVIFFLVCGTALLVFVISLIVNSAATLRFSAAMNRWVSLRAATRPLEIPHDTRSSVLKYRYVLAAVFVLGGAFTVYGLLMYFNTRAAVILLGLNTINPRAAAWLADSLRWALMFGNALAIVAGVMLAFFPNRVAALEAWGGKWISSRQATRGADAMHLGVESWVAMRPRAAGAIIVVMALILISTFGLLLPRLW
jgi:hypothetical protein